VRQEGILLALVETVDFIHEQDCRPAGIRAQHLRALNRFAYVLDAGEHCRQCDELSIEALRHQSRDGRFADSGRTPQNHRMRLARFECNP
jgi:hypothetical protein